MRLRRAHPVRQQAERLLRVFQRRQGAGPEPLALRVQLFEEMKARAVLRLLAEPVVHLLRGPAQFFLNQAQALLAFLQRAALRLRVDRSASTLAENCCSRAASPVRSSSNCAFSAESFSKRTALPSFCRSRALISLRARLNSCAREKDSAWAWRKASWAARNWFSTPCSAASLACLAC